MPTADLLVDTSIWVDFLHGSEPAARNLTLWLGERRVCICGVVVYELLAGVKKPEQRHELRSLLEALPYLETDRTVWDQAAEMNNLLRQKGIILPLSDVLVACLAQAHRCKVVTRDAHFSFVKGLRTSKLEDRDI